MSKEKKSWLEEVSEDAVNAVAGLLFGDVDDGPPDEERKAKNDVRNDDRNDDDTDDNSGDDDGADEKKARAPAEKRAATQEFKHIFEFTGVQPRRGPGRPAGSTSKKKSDTGTGGAE